MAIRHVLDVVTRAQSAIGETLMAGLAIFVALDAILRWSINWSFLVADEVGGYVMVIVSFFGMAIALHERALFRVEFFFHRLSASNRQRMQLAFDVLGLVFASLLAWSLTGLAIRSYEKGVVAPTVMLTPLWIPQAGMAFGMIMVALVLVMQVVDGARALRFGTDPGEVD